jgi:hypothetical protein
MLPVPDAVVSRIRQQLLELVEPARIRHMQTQLRTSLVYLNAHSSPARIGTIGKHRDLGLCVTLNSETLEITSNFCLMTPPRYVAHYLQFIAVLPEPITTKQVDSMTFTLAKWRKDDTIASAAVERMYYDPTTITLAAAGVPFTVRDRNAITEFGFVAVSGEVLPDGTPDTIVNLIIDLPLEEFLGYVSPETVVPPYLLEAMGTFRKTPWNPTEEVTFNATMCMHIHHHVTGCYVQTVMVEHGIVGPRDFIVWYFQQGKLMKVVESQPPPGKYFMAMPNRPLIPRYVSKEVGVYLQTDGATE